LAHYPLPITYYQSGGAAFLPTHAFDGVSRRFTTSQLFSYYLVFSQFTAFWLLAVTYTLPNKQAICYYIFSSV
jgi:hypothetical protein